MPPAIEALFASPWGALLIFGLRIIDVSCDTMRVLFAVRGKRGVAGVLGFFQALIWIFAVASAIKYVDSWIHVLGYAGGYATGTVVGITIERAVAFGVSTVRIVSAHGGVEIAEALRERGYGVTEHAGFGREGSVEIVNSVVQRAHMDDVMAIVDRFDPEAFVTVEEPKILRGGSVAAREWRIAPSWMRWGGGGGSGCGGGARVTDAVVTDGSLSDVSRRPRGVWDGVARGRVTHYAPTALRLTHSPPRHPVSSVTPHAEPDRHHDDPRPHADPRLTLPPRQLWPRPDRASRSPERAGSDPLLYRAIRAPRHAVTHHAPAPRTPAPRTPHPHRASAARTTPRPSDPARRRTPA